LAGKKKDKKKNKDKPKKLPYIDPSHIFTDNPDIYEIDKDHIKSFGQCSECGKNDFGVNDPKNAGLCGDCRKNPEIMEKHSKKCDICQNPVSATSNQYCSNHEVHCKDCGKEIDDLGQSDSNNNKYVPFDEELCSNCRHYCNNCKDQINDQDKFPDSKRCKGCRSFCKYCKDEITDFGKKDNSYQYGKIPEDELFCEDCRTHCEDCGQRITDQDDVGPDVKYCDEHRKICKECDGLIKDQDEYPYSPWCDNCRPYCENCHHQIDDDPQNNQEEHFCDSCRKQCKECSDLIEDQSEYPESDYCMIHRKYCHGCGEPIYDADDYPNSDFCEDHRNTCASCDEEVEDQIEHPEAGHCEYCRKECKDCGDKIVDDLYYPNTKKCEGHREICLQGYCQREVATEDEDPKTIAGLQGKFDIYGNPLTDYCPRHRHRCEICNENVHDYDFEKANEEIENDLSVPDSKTIDMGAHQNDKSSLQYLNIKNPDYLNKKPKINWYNMCEDCRNYVKGWGS
jgi:hypothetical protein